MSWKPSTIKFDCFGLEFEADVKLYPGYEGSREQPPEGPELTFEALRHLGHDVYWMVSSEFLLEKLDEAAWNQINNDWEEPDSYGPEDYE